MKKDALHAIQTDLRALNYELNEQCLAIRKGLRSTQRTGAIFADHPMAISRDSIFYLRGLMEHAADKDLAEIASRLYYACIGQFIRLELIMMDEMLDQFLSQVGIGIDGERLTFAGLVPWVMSQNKYEKREKLRKKALPLLKKACQLKERIWEATVTILQEDFGYSGYLLFCEEKKRLDLGRFKEACLEFLASTDQRYHQHISAWVEAEMNRPMGEVSRYHAMRLLHLTRFDHGFPGSNLTGILRASLRALKVESPIGRTLFLDLEDREGKSIASRCVPLHIPEEIHISIKPLGGLSDREAILHEMGHGLHFAFSDPALPYPYRHLPRSFALSECYGFLFQDLLSEPAWLYTHTELSGDEIDQLCYYRSLIRLCLVRRYMGKFLFEYEWFSGNDQAAGRIYKHWLERATGFLYEQEAAMMDVEEELYSVDYLRAWLGEVSLRSHLREQFGEEWFSRKEAGAFLVDLWKRGETWNLEDLLRHIGKDPSDLTPLKRSFEGALLH